jgi:hypothetical protein
VDNILALFEAIYRRALGVDDQERLASDLYDLARKYGFSHDEINEALDSEKMLTIYEP